MQRRDRRVQLACRNCRRKKTRCPGERPNCSTCVRLTQICEYSGNDTAYTAVVIPEHESTREDMSKTRSLEARVAELEQKLESMFQASQNDQKRTKDISKHLSSTAFTTTLRQDNAQKADSNAFVFESWHPDRDVTRKILDSYFWHCHKQPLWLFEDRTSLTREGRSDELLLLIFALVSLCAPEDVPGTHNPSVEQCSGTARSRILLKVANNDVDMSDLQAICLLAFLSFVQNDLRNCRWYLCLVKSLMRYLEIDKQQSSSTDTRSDDIRRLFWSVFHLEQLCEPMATQAMPIDIEEPTYFKMTTTTQSTGIKCPMMPTERSYETGQSEIGIWAHLVRMGIHWTLMKNFICRYAKNDITAPWLPDSDYNLINSSLLQFETTFIDFFRYPQSRFWARPVDEIEDKREYWVLWLNVQLTYHTIHAILNHPFLHAVTDSASRFGRNVFWKKSSELAFLHASWIAKLIELSKDRNLETFDPFTAHSAAVAASLHLYYCQATSESVRSTAELNLDVCRSFIQKLAKCWPICRFLSDALDQMIDSSHGRPLGLGEHSGVIGLNTSLMWKILDFSSLTQPVSMERGFTNCSVPATLHQREVQATHVPVETFSPNTTTAVDSAGKEYEPPVNWFDAVTSPPKRDNEADVRTRLQPENHTSTQQQNILTNVEGQIWSATAADTPLFNGETLIDPCDYPLLQLFDQSNFDEGWWDYGNL